MCWAQKENNDKYTIEQEKIFLILKYTLGKVGNHEKLNKKIILHASEVILNEL